MSCAGCIDCTLNSKESFFEIHVTVDIYLDQFNKFESVCVKNNVKALGISNVYNINGYYTPDFFTRSTVKGSYQDALNEMYRVSFILHQAGFKTLRHKIEAAPWVELPHSYIEAHLEVECDDFSHLYMISNLLDGHISYNANKRGVYLVTFRRNDLTLEQFQQFVDNKKKILAISYVVGKIVIEKAVYDDNEPHDLNWLNKNKR